MIMISRTITRPKGLKLIIITITTTIMIMTMIIVMIMIRFILSRLHAWILVSPKPLKIRFCRTQ